MASGLMTLAYMIEMAAVFNLAYLELNKARYVEGPKKLIDELRKRIEREEEGPVSTADWFKAKTELLDKLDALTSHHRLKRQAGWQTKSGANGNEKLRHYDRMACEVYEFFDNEKDKSLAQHYLIVTAALLPIITIFDHQGLHQLENTYFTVACISVVGLIAWTFHVSVNVFPRTLMLCMVALCLILDGIAYSAPDLTPHSYHFDAWWFFFWVLAVALVLPAAFIICGRRLRKVLTDVQDRYAREFDDLKSSPVEDALQAMPRSLAR
jgi:hypothetical protein